MHMMNFSWACFPNRAVWVWHDSQGLLGVRTLSWYQLDCSSYIMHGYFRIFEKRTSVRL